MADGDEEIENEDPIEGGFYGYEWPMLWPPRCREITSETLDFCDHA